jgi:DNA-binding LytR/AlgR family response regulator
MHSISVTKEVDGSGLFSVLINQILFIEYLRSEKRIIVHTELNTYYTVGTLVYWLDLFKLNGYNFARADRIGVINVDAIQLVDKFFCRAYFSAERRGKYCPLAEDRIKEIKRKASHTIVYA